MTGTSSIASSFMLDTISQKSRPAHKPARTEQAPIEEPATADPVTLYATGVAMFCDLLTSGNLSYTEQHENGAHSRPQAAVLLLAEGAVLPTGTLGIYRVKGTDNRRYYVDAMGPDLSCDCDDFFRHSPKPCKHILASQMHLSLLATFDVSVRDTISEWHEPLYGPGPGDDAPPAPPAPPLDYDDAALEADIEAMWR